jgi:hypothetical protein
VEIMCEICRKDTPKSDARLVNVTVTKMATV